MHDRDFSQKYTSTGIGPGSSSSAYQKSVEYKSNFGKAYMKEQLYKNQQDLLKQKHEAQSRRDYKLAHQAGRHATEKSKAARLLKDREERKKAASAA